MANALGSGPSVQSNGLAGSTPVVCTRREEEKHE